MESLFDVSKRHPAEVSLRLDLPAGGEAVGRARRGVRTALTRWRLPQFIDACQLAASELVSNAITHGRPPVGLSLRHRNTEIRLDVHDADPQEPCSPSSLEADSAIREGGRGWDIVQAISDDSGVEQIRDDGKRVFALWRIDRVRTPDG